MGVVEGAVGELVVPLSTLQVEGRTFLPRHLPNSCCDPSFSDGQSNEAHLVGRNVSTRRLHLFSKTVTHTKSHSLPRLGTLFGYEQRWPTFGRDPPSAHTSPPSPDRRLKPTRSLSVALKPWTKKKSRDQGTRQTLYFTYSSGASRKVRHCQILQY